MTELLQSERRWQMGRDQGAFEAFSRMEQKADEELGL